MKGKGGTEGFLDWLRAEKARQRLTNSDIADRVGVSSSTVSRWFTHGVQPSTETVRALAGALAADADELLALTGHSRQTPPTEQPELRRLLALIREANLTDYDIRIIASQVETLRELNEEMPGRRQAEELRTDAGAGRNDGNGRLHRGPVAE